MKFSVTGEIILENGQRKFSKELEAVSENTAKDMIYALFGSNNKLKRNKIKILTINKV